MLQTSGGVYRRCVELALLKSTAPRIRGGGRVEVDGAAAANCVGTSALEP